MYITNDALLIILVLVIGFIGVAIAVMKTRRSNPTQQKPEELKGKTLEEHKKDYLTSKKKHESDEELFLEVQDQINELMLKKGYSLSEAVGVVAEDYNKRGIYLTVDPSGSAFKISGNLPENFTVQKPAERKESESNFCESCGKSLKPTAKFCGSCGNQV